MSRAILSPVCDSAPIELSRKLYKKQVLPIRTINYKGRQINFDKSYLMELAKAYREGAFDQVPFMLADGDNKHTMDPDRFRGDVKGLSVEDDGLYAYIELSDDATALIERNPKLGVSARIIEGLEHADGRQFGRAVQHVLGTLDPRVTGMKPWEEVSLSYESVDETVDLTNETYEQEGLVMVDDQDATADEGTDSVFDEALYQDFTADYEEEGVSVTTEDIELVRAENLDSQMRITQLETELALSRFEKEKAELIDAGVPPKMIDLASSVLQMPHPPIIDLARGEGDERYVDLSKVVRDILHEAKGTIDLGRELGDLEGGDGTTDDDVLAAWESQS